MTRPRLSAIHWVLFIAATPFLVVLPSQSGSAVDAGSVTYGPANPPDWSPAPDDVAEALDQAGGRLEDLETGDLDAAADIVFLRVSCPLELDNCFETTASLTTWLWGGGSGDRSPPPSEFDPVLVRIGPGEFDPLLCAATAQDPDGWVSFQGAGREHTRFVQSVSGVAAIDVTHCDFLEFHDLTAFGRSDAVARGVYWKGSGRGTWWDTDTIAEGLPGAGGVVQAWYDSGADIVQYLFGCRVEARGQAAFAVAYEVGAAEVWFYGGEITLRPTAEPGAPFNMSFWPTLYLASLGEIRIFGSAVRAVTDQAPGVTGTITGVFMQSTGRLHMHGGIISLDGSGTGADVDVIGIDTSFLNVSNFAHTPDTAWSLIAGGTGTATRLLGPGTMQSPFQWPAGPNPPNVTSTHGSDLFVDTEAGSSSQEAHLMVYDTSCTGSGGTWRDMATGACR